MTDISALWVKVHEPYHLAHGQVDTSQSLGHLEETSLSEERALRETHLVADRSLDNALCPVLIPVVTICIISWLSNDSLGALQAAGSAVSLINTGGELFF